MTVHEAYQAFKAADTQWTIALELAFGKRAADVRYTQEGRTHPICASKYEAFKLAGEVWRQAMTSNGRSTT